MNLVRSLLAEFESTRKGTPVAIVYVLVLNSASYSFQLTLFDKSGAREFIFSEKIGVLGDVAAGKEYTFGTIAQRVSSKLGGVN